MPEQADAPIIVVNVDERGFVVKAASTVPLKLVVYNEFAGHAGVYNTDASPYGVEAAERLFEIINSKQERLITEEQNVEQPPQLEPSDAA